MTSLNIAELFEESANRYTSKIALHYPVGKTYQSVSFSDLLQYSHYLGYCLSKKGVKAGDRILVLVRPGPSLVAVTFALFRIGAIPVMIDPGMGISRVLECIQHVHPRGMISISMVHWFRLFNSNPLKSVELAFSIGGIVPWGVNRLWTIERFLKEKPSGWTPVSMFQPKAKEIAAILFTTGSTGPAKGVLYSHAVFLAQTRIIQETYCAGPEYIDMPAFPLFSMFSMVSGMSCVIPRIDPSYPAKADPKILADTIDRFNISFSFGSPTLWRNVANYCIQNNRKLPSLKKVLMAGAPVTADLHRNLKSLIHSDGDTYVPYGATESMPISSFTGSAMLKECERLTREGKGYCVGYPTAGSEFFIIKAVDTPIAEWSDDLVLPREEIGEIVIHSPTVSLGYDGLPKATELSKIKFSDGSYAHRMGDMGYIDSLGRIWFCGRKNHRVISSTQTFYSVCVESIFNQCLRIERSALVGVGEIPNQIPVIVIQLKKDFPVKNESELCGLKNELLALSQSSHLTDSITQILFYPGEFPTDIRHNAKIFREKLTIWAQNKINIS